MGGTQSSGNLDQDNARLLRVVPMSCCHKRSDVAHKPQATRRGQYGLTRHWCGQVPELDCRVPTGSLKQKSAQTWFSKISPECTVSLRGAGGPTRATPCFALQPNATTRLSGQGARAPRRLRTRPDEASSARKLDEKKQTISRSLGVLTQSKGLHRAFPTARSASRRLQLPTATRASAGLWTAETAGAECLGTPIFSALC
jgi:hypothetical protein